MAAETLTVTQATTFFVIPMLLWSWELILCSPPLSPGGEHQENKSKQALQNTGPVNRYCNWPLQFNPFIFVHSQFFFSLWVPGRVYLRVKSQFIGIKSCLARQLVAPTMSVMMMWWRQTWLPEGLKSLFSRPCRADNLRFLLAGMLPGNH